MDITAIRSKIDTLANRDWPQEWGAQEEREIGDFFGWCHRYRFDPPLSKIEIAAFEREHGVSLPADYRAYLAELGNGGAGPAYGIFPLGEGEDEAINAAILEGLGQEFGLEGPWNDQSLPKDGEGYYSEKVMAGAMPISTLGSAIDLWMVVSGAQSGQIWIDKRSDDEGIAPITDSNGQVASFGTWYTEWLEDAFARFAAN